MRGKFEFDGSGGELFSLMLVQGILTVITFGIYAPWAIAAIYRYMADHSRLDGKPFEFTGKGGDIFSLYLINYILTAVTVGIYAPIAQLRIIEYFTKQIRYEGRNFEFDGGDACNFWCLLFVQNILTAITLGLYMPWAIVKITENIMQRTSYDGKQFDFKAEGGHLFSLYFINGLLTVITLGIYGPWAIAKIKNYVTNCTTYGDDTRFDLELNGAELFSIIIVHGLILCAITLGIYYPWFLVKMNKYVYSKMQMIGYESLENPV